MSDTIYYNVLEHLPNGKSVQGIDFQGAACFGDWPCNMGNYQRMLNDMLPGHFAVVLDAFIDEYRWSHKELVKSAVKWMNDHGFRARLYVTQDCYIDGDDLPNGTPVITVSYELSDNRAKIYHALCFARYFTREFTQALDDRNVIRRRSLQTYFSWLFEDNLRLDSHMPFVDYFVASEYWYDRERVKPDVTCDRYLGLVYLDYLDTLYTEGYWERLDTATIRPGITKFWTYWTGGIYHTSWATFYKKRIQAYTGAA